jgi:hypothetical protein
MILWCFQRASIPPLRGACRISRAEMFSGDDNSHLRTRSQDASIVVPREMDDRRSARQVIGSGGAYGTANARDAELHLLQQTASNGVVVT